MKKMNLLKGAMVGVALCVSFDLGALPGSVAVVGWATDQNSEGV